MAVYTEISHYEASSLMHKLGLGELHSLKGITGGIENTNYFATTNKGEFVLTVFERLTFEQLPYYLHLMQHLAAKGMAVPDPKADANGVILHKMQGKPCAVVNKLSGSSDLSPSIAHCAEVGTKLAQMHLAGQDFAMQQNNLRGLDWWTETVPVVLPFLSPEQSALLQTELAFQQKVAQSADFAALPRGPIHADLFRDNVLFSDDIQTDGSTKHVCAFFDFYFAANDSFLFDLAVCLNDWCIAHRTGEQDDAKAQAFLASYTAVRPLQQAESALLPAMLRAGALRFWISRLWDFYLPRAASQLQAHDPTHFERVLQQRITQQQAKESLVV